jgi:hypothetical protein
MPKEVNRITLRGEPSGKVKGYLVFYDDSTVRLICLECEARLLSQSL